MRTMRKRPPKRNSNDPDYWLWKEPPPGQPCVVQDTLIEFWDLRGWCEGYQAIAGRPPSSDKYAAQRALVEALPLSYIKHCPNPCDLLLARKYLKKLRPSRGQRQDHPTTRLIMEVNNRLNAKGRK